MHCQNPSIKKIVKAKIIQFGFHPLLPQRIHGEILPVLRCGSHGIAIGIYIVFGNPESAQSSHGYDLLIAKQEYFIFSAQVEQRLTKHHDFSIALPEWLERIDVVLCKKLVKVIRRRVEMLYGVF